MPSPHTIGTLESFGALQAVVRSKLYIPYPGAITLDGEGGSQTNTVQESFLSQVRNLVGNKNSEYVEIHEAGTGDGFLKTEDQLWDDVEETHQDWEDNEKV